jgi:hypothetical protein
MDNTNKSLRGNASQFFVAAELCRREYVAVVTMGNCPNTDILCSNIKATKFIHIQVKTFRPGDTSCSVGRKSEIDYGKNFFWILAGIPLKNDSSDFLYYIIPSSDMAKNVKEQHVIWSSTPGKKGQKHNETSFRTVLLPPKINLNDWDLSKYRNRWDFIERKLK